MTQEEWENAVKNSMLAKMQTSTYPIRSANNGYSLMPPSYNPYSVQFNQSAPPINQALSFTPRSTPQPAYQPRYNYSTNYNGQPIAIPSNAPSRLWNEAVGAADNIKNGIVDFAKDKVVQDALMGGALTTYLLNDSPIMTAKATINRYPALQNAIATLAATRLGMPVVNGVKNLANNPYVQKVDNAIGKLAKWF